MSIASTDSILTVPRAFKLAARAAVKERSLALHLLAKYAKMEVAMAMGLVDTHTSHSLQLWLIVARVTMHATKLGLKVITEVITEVMVEVRLEAL